MKNCKHCEKEFSHKGTRCRTCISRIRRYNNKVKSVEYLGGKCKMCGYDESICALEFHHVDSDDKEKAIGTMLNRTWKYIKKELDKCILLCSNCHRREHCKYDSIDEISPGG